MDDTPLHESDEVSISERPDARYGPEIRLVKNARTVAKIEVEDLETDTLIVYQHTPKWALEAVHNADYETVYIHDRTRQIGSYEELMRVVRETYGD